MKNDLIETLRGMDYEDLYGQWRYAGSNNWYLHGEAGKWLSNRLDVFRANLTAQERAEIEAKVESRFLLDFFAGKSPTNG